MMENEEGIQQQQRLKQFINEILVPIKQLKNFNKLFIIGDSPELALSTDKFFLQRQEYEQYQCIRFVEFHLVIFSDYCQLPKKLLLDNNPHYSFHSVGKKNASDYNRYKLEEFVKVYLCGILKASLQQEGDEQIITLKRKKHRI